LVTRKDEFMKMFSMCINWKVVAAVAAIAVGLFVFVPKLATAALPLLIAVICPLSMLLAMGLMGRMGSGNQSASAPDNNASVNGHQASASCCTSAELPVGRREQLAQLKARQQELAAKITALEDVPMTQTSPKQLAMTMKD
jgi:hypothetical protein